MKLFNDIQFNKPKKNKFDLSHEKKLTMKMGAMVPILLQEVIPGDQFRVNTEMLMRLQPMLAPIMHRVRVKTDYFFVPNRLVWDNWQKFITGGEDGLSTNVSPYVLIETGIPANLIEKSTLWDYYGMPSFDPTGMPGQLKVNAMPFRAYQLIYNEYYRDQNLVPEITIAKTDGLEPNTAAMLKLRTSAWEKDYFTSALPFAQKGGPVSLPIDPVVNYKNISIVKQSGTGANADGALSVDPITGDLHDVSGTARIENIQDITNASTTINDLRVAVRLQEWLEKNARAGSRYIESILAHFGVRSSDARLQRPEYLGGSSNPIVISEVLSTFQFSGDPDGAPQGNMSGHGVSAGNVPGFKRSFEEHGFVIGIMRVLPKTAYQQGIPKFMTRTDKLEYAWPSFAQLGEQEVRNQELYFDKALPDATNQGTFGYQSRYAEYKFNCGTVHGDFKTNLSFWHMGRIFAAPPVLNESFITADPTKRVFAVTDPTEDELLVQLYNSISALRPLPYFNTPTL
ncbi:MAG: major capsid protein [Microviridae sp.]|nr:MAG: major capsid protein [Microviridae sp.]